MNLERIGSVLLPAMWTALGGALVFFILITIILNYHWTRYGVDPEQLKRIRIIYFGVSILLLGIMALLALSVPKQL